MTESVRCKTAVCYACSRGTRRCATGAPSTYAAPLFAEATPHFCDATGKLARQLASFSSSASNPPEAATLSTAEVQAKGCVSRVRRVGASYNRSPAWGRMRNRAGETSGAPRSSTEKEVGEGSEERESGCSPGYQPVRCRGRAHVSAQKRRAKPPGVASSKLPALAPLILVRD
jgi:hypothetical protein